MPEQRMSAQLARLAKKRGRLPALVTALGLGLLLSVQQLLGWLLGWLGLSGTVAMQSDAAAAEPGAMQGAITFDPNLLDLLYYVIPLALGVFLALWLLAPISHELTLRFVLTRAALASATAALVYMLAGVVVALLVWFGVEIDGFGPFGWWGRATLLQNVFGSLVGAIQVFVRITPLVMFAVVLLWLWLREHPREYEVAGIIDEV